MRRRRATALIYAQGSTPISRLLTQIINACQIDVSLSLSFVLYYARHAL